MAIMLSVGRSLLSRPWSAAKKYADAVGSPQENTTPNSHGSTRNREYSPSTVGPPTLATSRLATDTAASAPACAPRFEMVARLTSPPALEPAIHSDDPPEIHHGQRLASLPKMATMPKRAHKKRKCRTSS